MKKTLFAAAVVAAFTFSACSGDNTAHHDEGTTSPHASTETANAEGNVVVETPDFSSVAEPMKTQVSQLVDRYIKLKDALVASDPAAAKAAANEVLTVANAMPVASLTDGKEYAEEKRTVVVEKATTMAGSEDLAVQRENLEELSKAVFSMAKAFGAAEGTLYYQHCPMAFNDKGASWLSNKEEIRNPYYGDAMLACGYNEEIYKK